MRPRKVGKMNTLPAIQSGQMGYTFGNLGNCEKKCNFLLGATKEEQQTNFIGLSTFSIRARWAFKHLSQFCQFFCEHWAASFLNKLSCQGNWMQLVVWSATWSMLQIPTSQLKIVTQFHRRSWKYDDFFHMQVEGCRSDGWYHLQPRSSDDGTQDSASTRNSRSDKFGNQGWWNYWSFYICLLFKFQDYARILEQSLIPLLAAWFYIPSLCGPKPHNYCECISFHEMPWLQSLAHMQLCIILCLFIMAAATVGLTNSRPHKVSKQKTAPCSQNATMGWTYGA